MTTASSTPPSDATVVIGNVRHWQEKCERLEQRISTLERELGASDAALLAIADAASTDDTFDAIYHSDPIIEAARRRSAT